MPKSTKRKKPVKKISLTGAELIKMLDHAMGIGYQKAILELKRQNALAWAKWLELKRDEILNDHARIK